MQPGAPEEQQPLLLQLRQYGTPERRGRIGEAHAPQAPGIGPGLVGNLLVEAGEGGERALAQCLPTFGHQHETLSTGLDPERLRWQRKLLRCTAAQPNELCDPHAVARLSQQRLDSTTLDPLFESRKGCEPSGCASAARRGLWIEHAAPADRVAPLRIADNEALSAGRAHGSIEDELHAGRVPGGQARLLERHDVS